ncbi:MAG: DUF2461 domain-containing protein [Propionicimonas sp.]|uniref:DUF2461 domain-containing protein n=1 Tax=Propionicimonas sp. TaxID=1955623 RepID=UPI002B1ED231|nr:DUF2461 domain-containing protein [Propionicimonas sp.]MEA4943030.1 DUF2461 domain-containing protein [Propionicimonas sp.]MEA5052496.1 DUF2461 domain-containing protein [Propionicimonas sp.]MEA5116798.1 DUF2461 domain-containing protein [Propionicimonas sp.]
MTFSGFSPAALEFYDHLEVENTREFWEAHREVYESAVRQPMQELVDDLAAEFGTAKLFRPYRDLRFSRDKTPFKTHQGGFVATGEATGYYVELSGDGVLVAAGAYHLAGERLARIRRSIDVEHSGVALQKTVKSLARKGLLLGGDMLKTCPRGFSADHPRIDLLRHRTLTVSRNYGTAELVHSPELVAAVRDDWRAAAPLLAWLERHG